MTRNTVPIEAPAPAVHEGDGGELRNSPTTASRLGQNKDGAQRAAANHGTLPADDGDAGDSQDTPGKPKSASSRQQTRPDQESQTGSSELDSSSPR